MDPFGLFVFSMAIAIFGAFRAIPYTQIQPSSDFIQRLQGGFRVGYIMGRIGEVVDMISPPRYENDSWYKTRKWETDLSYAEKTPSVPEGGATPAMTDGISARKMVIFFPPAASETPFPITTTLGAPLFYPDAARSSAIPFDNEAYDKLFGTFESRLEEFKTQLVKNITSEPPPGWVLLEMVEDRLKEFKSQLEEDLTAPFEVHLNVTGEIVTNIWEIVDARLMEFRSQILKETSPVSPRDPWCCAGMWFWLAPLLAFIISFHNFRKEQSLENEISTFTSAINVARDEADNIIQYVRHFSGEMTQRLDVQSRYMGQEMDRVNDHVKWLEETLYDVCDQHMTGIETVVGEERQRIRNEITKIFTDVITPFRANILGGLGGQLADLQEELDKQDARVKDYVKAMQNLPLKIPDTTTLEQQYEEFQEEIELARGRIGNFLYRIDEESVSHGKLEDSMKKFEDWLVHLVDRQDAIEYAALQIQSRQDDLEARVTTTTHSLPRETIQSRADANDDTASKTEDETSGASTPVTVVPAGAEEEESRTKQDAAAPLTPSRPAPAVSKEEQMAREEWEEAGPSAPVTPAARASATTGQAGSVHAWRAMAAAASPAATSSADTGQAGSVHAWRAMAAAASPAATSSADTGQAGSVHAWRAMAAAAPSTSRDEDGDQTRRIRAERAQQRILEQQQRGIKSQKKKGKQPLR